MANVDPIATLADPSRKRIFELLKSGPLHVGRIAEQLPISRAAVSQHLKVLKEAGLVQEAREGNRNAYSIDPKGLAAVQRWLDQFWEDGLSAFKVEAEATARSKQRRKRR
ncbi:MAG: winged helix-turn-helix transcriptional regulator [Xanthomonadaceae bacterium]|nr:winged helix-turn-helix transcriptional regulator [Xanthomonadaceae bacterium]